MVDNNSDLYSLDFDSLPSAPYPTLDDNLDLQSVDFESLPSVSAPEQPMSSIHDPETNKNVLVPEGSDEDEQIYHVKTKLRNEEPESFWGTLKIGDLSGLATGLVGSTIKNVSDMYLSSVDQYTKDNIDFFQGLSGISEENRSKAIADMEEAVNKIPERRSNVDEFIAEYGLDKDDSDGILYDVGAGIGSFIPQIGIGLANPTLMMAYLYKQSQSSGYFEALESGKTQDEAESFAMRQGGVTALINRIGYSVFKGATGSAFTKVIKRSANEAFEEIAESIGGNINRIASDVKDLSVSEFINDAIYSGMIGGLSSAPISSVYTAIETKYGIKDQKTKGDIKKIIDLSYENSNDVFTEVVSQIPKDRKLKGGANTKKLVEVVKRFKTGQIKKEDVETALRDYGVSEDKILSIIEPQASKADDVISNGRAKFLENQLTAVDREIDVIQSTIVQRETDSRPVKSLQNKLSKLLDQRKITESELVAIEQTDGMAALSLAQSGDIDIKGYQVKKVEQAAFERVRKEVSSKVRQAVSLARSDAKAAKGVVIEAINQSPILDKDKVKLLSSSAVKNIDSSKNLSRQIYSINQKLERLSAKAFKSQADGIFKDIFSTFKKTGKLTSEVQSMVSDLSSLYKNNNSDRATQLLEAKFRPDHNPKDFDGEENAVLSLIASGDDATFDQYINAISALESMVYQGKAERFSQKQSRRQQLDTEKAVVNKGLDGIQDSVYSDLQDNRNFVNRWGDRVLSLVTGSDPKGIRRKLFLDSVATWADYVDRIFPTDKPLTQEAKDFYKKYVDDLNEKLFKASSAKVESEQLLGEMYADIFWGKADSKSPQAKFMWAKARMRNDMVRTIEIADGLKISKDQARMIKMLSFNEKTAERGVSLKPEKGFRKKKMTVQEATDIIDAKGVLDANDNAYIDLLFEYYNKRYADVNDVYSRVYGVNLPFIDFYVSVMSEQGNVDISNDAFKSPLSLPSIIKQRKSKNDIIIRDASMAALNYAHKADHYVEMHEIIRDVSSIFGDGEIRTKLREVYGDYYVNNIDTLIRTINGNNMHQGPGENAWNKLSRNVAAFYLLAKPMQFVKQSTSAIMMSKGISTADFHLGMVDFFLDPVGNTKKMVKSDIIKTRLNSDALKVQFAEFEKALDREPSIFRRMAIEADKSGDLAYTSDRITDILSSSAKSFTKYGDLSLPFIVAGHARIRHLTRKGMLYEDAVRDFTKLADTTQQSRSADQVTPMAARGTWGQILNKFGSAQLSAMRVINRDVVKFKRGDIGIRDLADSYLKLWVLPYVGFKVASDALFMMFYDFEEEDEEFEDYLMSYIPVALAGPYARFPLIGEFIYNGINAFSGQKNFDPSLPVQSLIKEFTRAIENVNSLIEFYGENDLDLDSEFFFEAIYEMKETIGLATGKPISTLARQFNGIIDSVEADNEHYTRAALMDILGTPASQAKKVAKQSGEIRQQDMTPSQRRKQLIE